MDDLKEAFAELLLAEQQAVKAERKLAEAKNQLNHDVILAGNAVMEAWDRIKAILSETGEIDPVIEGEYFDYVIAWSKARENPVVTEEALPDHLIEIKRTPKMREIKEELKKIKNGAFPNWGKLEKGKSELNYRVIKKKKK